MSAIITGEAVVLELRPASFAARSVGKLAVGLRLVRDDGGSIRFRHALMGGLLGAFAIRAFTHRN
jgi:uncharacterized RDD family membrane protein YckC